MASAVQWPTDTSVGSGGGGGGGGRSTDEDAANEAQHPAFSDANDTSLEASLGKDLQAAIDELGKNFLSD